MYALRDVPGKGKGLIAIENIPKGTQILSEQPVITTPKRQLDEERLKAQISQQVDSLSLDSSRAIRQKKLQDKFGFVCSCRLCSLSAEESQKNDKRLERIQELDDLVGREGMRMNFSLRTLRYVDERVRLYNEQGPGNSGLTRAYLDAAQIAIANGDLARGRVFAERAVEGWRVAQGSDSKEVIEYSSLVRNPAKLPLYGMSMKWKTSLEEIPQGLDVTDFEDWLWRREKPKKLEQVGQLTDLRNREIFPSFAGLPNSKSRDPDFYESVGGTLKPTRDWCFLGEIVGSTVLHHLELELKDIDDKKLPLHFNTTDRGSNLAPAQIQKGYTVAVLHAQRHVFMYGDPGIPHDNPQKLKIFPVSLKKLLELSDQGCQATGWNKRGHKADCKVLKSSNLQGLLALE
ncbi:hypothetical protein P154DRAFT_439700 [Amniculicola lignicola CBS 123094]|uniref:SET domain-containing protein n=1 Tax=Amniculicola lignicola CBS 123094 TaxID=1392246 RepID=A0A6A5W9X0_9PLEO|nr:hypothetical protein P154DRAFT_439700 [Amniculicola lignicola CBS 123094]